MKTLLKRTLNAMLEVDFRVSFAVFWIVVMSVMYMDSRDERETNQQNYEAQQVEQFRQIEEARISEILNRYN